MVLVAVLTGLRRGELFALRWGAVDFERKAIHVRESVYEGHFSTPKTRSSVRTLPMGEAFERVLLRLRTTDGAAGALVFRSRRGTALRPNNMLKRVIHPACARAGLPKVGWHDLRLRKTKGVINRRPPLPFANSSKRSGNLTCFPLSSTPLSGAMPICYANT